MPSDKLSPNMVNMLEMRVSSLICAVVLLLVGLLANSSTAAKLKRLQYHQQGLRDAPSHVSYRFGYIAGNKDNPQSRHEISPEPGVVSGAYSFVDANNKLQYVKYEAHPEHGFRIVDTWVGDPQTGKPDSEKN